MSAIAPSSAVRKPPARFHVFLSLILAAIAFGGFSLTYLHSMATVGFPAPVIVHIHAVLLFGWFVLLVVQSRLAGTSIATHRDVGLIGVSLATAMVLTAFALISFDLNEAVEAGRQASARSLAVVPVFAITMFAVAFVLAVVNVRRPEYHKRFIVLATVALMAPAIARVLLTLAADGYVPGSRTSLAVAVPDVTLALRLILVPAFIADLLILIPAIHDWKTRGRPHAVYVAGGIAFLVAHGLRPWVAGTEVWYRFTDALIALAH